MFSFIIHQLEWHVLPYAAGKAVYGDIPPAGAGKQHDTDGPVGTERFCLCARGSDWSKPASRIPKRQRIRLCRPWNSPESEPETQ